MPWIVGIDEAGYGPNLGPFVMTAVACRMSEGHRAADLWDVFKNVARRHSEPADSRFVVADSKMVYTQARGLAALEHTVHAALHGFTGLRLADIVDRLASACHPELRREIWYDGTTPLPVEAEGEVCSQAGQGLGDLCQGLAIHWGPIASALVCPTAFNAVLDRCQTKGAVLATSLVSLLRMLPRDDEAVLVCIDKHGGRDTYAAVLQPAFDNGMVIARAEGRLCSIYEVQDGARQVQVTFAPRADGSHFCVALASMVSKYLRELLMMEFNRFWQAKVPGLKPTAGYPTDAKRFWADIRETVRSLGVEENTLWRRK